MKNQTTLVYNFDIISMSNNLEPNPKYILTTSRSKCQARHHISMEFVWQLVKYNPSKKITSFLQEEAIKYYMTHIYYSF